MTEMGSILTLLVKCAVANADALRTIEGEISLRTESRQCRIAITRAIDATAELLKFLDAEGIK